MGRQWKRDYRISLSHKAQLLVGDIALEATIVDISKSGARVACAEQFEVGEIVQIQLDQHAAVPAEVKWSNQGEFGAYFLTPIEKFD